MRWNWYHPHFTDRKVRQKQIKHLCYHCLYLHNITTHIVVIRYIVFIKHNYSVCSCTICRVGQGSQDITPNPVQMSTPLAVYGPTSRNKGVLCDYLQKTNVILKPQTLSEYVHSEFHLWILVHVIQVKYMILDSTSKNDDERTWI